MLFTRSEAVDSMIMFTRSEAVGNMTMLFT
jgi:hypothetical protein